jgi:hypothetical protein
MNFFSGLMSGDAGTERRRLAGESPDGETRSPGDSRRLNQARALMLPPSRERKSRSKPDFMFPGPTVHSCARCLKEVPKWLQRSGASVCEVANSGCRGEMMM